MRVVVAGATGVVGRQVVPLLTAAGHEVVALSRKPGPQLAAGVRAVSVDALDQAALAASVRDAQPDAVVHLLTAIPARIDPRRMERDFALTNRLRTESARTLAAAAGDAGARFLAQGLAYAYDPAPGAADEDAPFWNRPPKQWATTLEALRTLERITAEAGGLVLRFGHLYGPGTAFGRGGSSLAQISARKMPVVGDGSGTFSFTHTRDAASAVVAALGHPQVSGALNIVDDEPALLRDWLPGVAALLGAPAPQKVPTAMARLAAGAWGAAFMTRLRGADNSRAKQALEWAPRYPTWREGFAAEHLGSELAA
ncbi:NAD-dependent epimerase/dehydratase family protein [Actinacidiphila bryophytorum]|uniref:NAD-dependent epimerase/dehydratase family protein n=1 Tax=Actinacidiphila bryophytorum TaxID=1436133 RepID=UPI002176A3B8|nr:NAD-dependent epimerase/dehydratase family protein [Actinacidiphila bryophytorum]UWE07603.1 NAD-dependent epimerase/dehydratase family protein [Actinacidiphila bryophytorum]